jgi:hypothetical protein
MSAKAIKGLRWVERQGEHRAGEVVFGFWKIETIEIRWNKAKPLWIDRLCQFGELRIPVDRSHREAFGEKAARVPKCAGADVDRLALAGDMFDCLDQQRRGWPVPRDLVILRWPFVVSLRHSRSVFSGFLATACAGARAPACIPCAACWRV